MGLCAIEEMSAGNSAGAIYIRDRNSVGEQNCRGAKNECGKQNGSERISWPPDMRKHDGTITGLNNYTIKELHD